MPLTVFAIGVAIQPRVFFFVGVVPYIIISLFLIVYFQIWVNCALWGRNVRGSRDLAAPMDQIPKKRLIEWRLARRNAFWVGVWVLLILVFASAAMHYVQLSGDYGYEQSAADRPAHWLRRCAEVFLLCVEVCILSYAKRV
jgi:hypothetical protein